jgi:signal transduction histidine kinase/CheY-like chemotaxis protein
MSQPSQFRNDWWEKISIRQKLQYSISAFALLVLSISIATIAWSNNDFVDRNMKRELFMLASVLAENSQAAVSFDDPASASKILSAITSNNNILWAGIYKNNHLFTAYPVNSKHVVAMRPRNTQEVWFDENFYYANKPIIVNEQIISHLLLKSKVNFWDLYWKRLLILFFTLIIAVALLSYFMSYWLKQHITLPLKGLSEWTQQVYQQKNYQAKAEKKSDDEIGQLADSLNHMLVELSKQESIVSLNRSLQKEITVREETEQKLIEMRDIAEQANRSKSAFLANMSHEIRTPMNAIIGFLDIVLEGTLFNEQRKNLDIVRRSANDLHLLLNDILDVAKLEEGKLLLEKLSFSIEQLVSHVVKTFEIKAKSKNIVLIQKIPEHVPEFFVGDPLRLRQILVNLVGNAVKFTESGTIMIAVDYTKKKHLKFLVRDTGIGIEENKLPHIFDSFSQEDSSTSRKYGGSGLGTTISKQLVNLMGGEIWAESDKGIGSTFQFYICLSVAEKADVEKSIKINPELLKVNKPLNILVAEDVEQNAELLKIRLVSLGHTVVHVENGRAAVDKFSNEVFDIILMDIQMPEMDGLTASRTIRSLSNGADIPILALTASVLNEDKRASKDAGMDGFVKKPIVFNELYSEMARVLEERFQLPSIEQNQDVKTKRKAFAVINVDNALEVWGDMALYLKNLKRFHKQHASECRLLSTQIKKQDYHEIDKVIHRLKGVAGNLALDEVCAELKIFSGYLKDKNYQAIEEHFEIFEKAYMNVMSEIEKLEENLEGIGVLDEVTEVEIVDKIIKLSYLLKQGKLDDNLVQELQRRLPRLNVDREAVHDMFQLIDEFDYESAYELLEEILAKVDIS